MNSKNVFLLFSLCLICSLLIVIDSSNNVEANEPVKEINISVVEPISSGINEASFQGGFSEPSYPVCQEQQLTTFYNKDIEQTEVHTSSPFTISNPGMLTIKGYTMEGHPDMSECSASAGSHKRCNQDQDKESYTIHLRSGSFGSESLIGTYNDYQGSGGGWDKRNWWHPAGDFNKFVSPGTYSLVLRHKHAGGSGERQSVGAKLVACLEVQPTPTLPASTATPTPTPPPNTPTPVPTLPPNTVTPTPTPTTPSTDVTPYPEPDAYCPADYEQVGSIVSDDIHYSYKASHEFPTASNANVLVTGYAMEGHPDRGCSPSGTLNSDYGISGCNQNQPDESFFVSLNGIDIGGYDDKRDSSKQNYWYPTGNISGSVTNGNHEISVRHKAGNGQSVGVKLAICVKEMQQAQFDYGDAPTSYGIAEHKIKDGIRLGNQVDGESGSQHSTNAQGDDSSGADDEDGISFQNGASAAPDETFSVNYSVLNQVHFDDFLVGWIDWNQDGSYQGNESIVPGGSIVFYKSNSVQSGSFSITVPSEAECGTTYARFRFGSDILGPTGEHHAGEVEDYTFEVVCATATPTPTSTITPTPTVIPTQTLPPTPTPNAPSCNDYQITGVANDTDQPGASVTVYITIKDIYGRQYPYSVTSSAGRFVFNIPDEFKDDYLHDVTVSASNPYTTQVWVSTGLDENENPTGYYQTINNPSYAYVDFAAFRCEPPSTDLSSEGEAWAKKPGRPGSYPSGDLATQVIWLEDTAQFEIIVKNLDPILPAINTEFTINLPDNPAGPGHPNGFLDWDIDTHPNWSCTTSNSQISCEIARFESMHTKTKYGTGETEYTLIEAESLVPGYYLPDDMGWDGEIESDTPDSFLSNNDADFDLRVIKTWLQTVSPTELMSQFNQVIYHESIADQLVSAEAERTFEPDELITSVFQVPVYEVPGITLSTYPTLTVEFCVEYSETNCSNDSAIIEGAVRVNQYTYDTTQKQIIFGGTLMDDTASSNVQTGSISLDYGLSAGGRFLDEDPSHCKAWIDRMQTVGENSQCAGRYEVYSTFSASDKNNYEWDESEMLGLLLYSSGGRTVSCDLAGSGCISSDAAEPGIYKTSGTINYEVIFYDDLYLRLGSNPLYYPYGVDFQIFNQQVTQFQEMER
ncbi:MAG: GEVED domain-containing protein [Chloroflexota bacterium]